MYAVAVRRDFIAHHMLNGGDWKPENELHAHHYFVRIFWRALLQTINSDMLTALRIKIWENEVAWAEYREDF